MRIIALLFFTYQSKSGAATIKLGYLLRAINSDSPVWMPYRLAGMLLASTTPWRFSSSPPTTAGTVRRSSVSPLARCWMAVQDKKGGVDIYMEINGFGFGRHGAHLLCGAKFLLPSYHKTTVQKSRSRIFFPFCGGRCIIQIRPSCGKNLQRATPHNSRLAA